jgi:hypothetical protein
MGAVYPLDPGVFKTRGRKEEEKGTQLVLDGVLRPRRKGDITGCFLSSEVARRLSG